MAKDRDDKSGYSQRITANKLQQSYQVKPGETMTSIAASAGISPEELARVNRGATPLDVGQTIRVPRFDTEAAPTSGPLSALPKTDLALERASSIFGGPRPPVPAAPRFDEERPTVGVRSVGVAPTTSLTDAYGVRSDPVTGFSAVSGNSSLRFTLDNGLEVGAISTVSDFRTLAARSGTTESKLATQLGYTKFGGTYVYVGAEVATSGGGSGGGFTPDPNYKAVSGYNYQPRPWYGAYSIDQYGKVHGGNKWRVDKETGETRSTKRYRKPSGGGGSQPQAQPVQLDQYGNPVANLSFRASTG